uniref:Immunoglobulin V-set domain-containing protein n=1 Tax=Sphaeramia orbicularis TaxID=375764 RepID=A0A673AC24_9TELE
MLPIEHHTAISTFLKILLKKNGRRSTDVKTLFVQTGKDVLLEIMDPDAVKDYILLAWRVKKKDNDPEYLVSFSPVDGPDVPENYSKTVFPQANFSVILKNVQKADRGLYDAQLTTRSGQRILVTYNITVLDPVSPVKLTVEPVSSSPDSCNVTVSCTTDDYTISSTLTCTHQTSAQRMLNTILCYVHIIVNKKKHDEMNFLQYFSNLYTFKYTHKLTHK